MNFFENPNVKKMPILVAMDSQFIKVMNIKLTEV